MFEGLTDLGREYLAKCLAEEKPVELVKVKIGDGMLSEEDDPESFSDIKAIKKEVQILEKTQENENLSFIIQIDNEGLEKGFYPREIGIYVRDGEEEKLYWYINDGLKCQWLPPASKAPAKYTTTINMMVSTLESIIVNWSGKGLWLDKEYFDKKVKVTQIATVEEMKSRRNLKVGDIVELLGYYNIFDGATHKRIISSTNDGSGVLLDNGLYANILTERIIKVKDFGAVGDGVTDDTDAIQKAFDLAGKINGIIEFEMQKTYGVTAKNGIYISGGYGPSFLPCCISVSGNVTINGNNSTLLYLVTQEEYDNPENTGGVILCAESMEVTGTTSQNNNKPKNKGQVIYINSLYIDGGFNIIDGALHSERRLKYCQGMNFDTLRNKNFASVTLINCKVENTFAEGVRGYPTSFTALGCKFANSWPTSINVRPKTGIMRNCVVETGLEASGLFEVFGTDDYSLFEIVDCAIYARSDAQMGILALFASQNYDKQPTNKIVFKNNVIHIDRIKPDNKVGNILTIRGYDVEFDGNRILWEGENEYVVSNDSNQITIVDAVNLIARNNYFLIGESCSEFRDTSFFRYARIDNVITENNYVDVSSNNTDKISPVFDEYRTDGWKVRYKMSLKTTEDKIFEYEQFIKSLPMFKAIEIRLEKSATISITLTPASAYGNAGQELKICENEYIDSRIGKIIYKNIGDTKATYLLKAFYLKGISDVEVNGTITFIV